MNKEIEQIEKEVKALNERIEKLKAEVKPKFEPIKGNWYWARCVGEIDGNVFTTEFWQAAKLISEHSKAKIMVGCSKQFDVSIDQINAILEKLK